MYIVYILQDQDLMPQNVLYGPHEPFKTPEFNFYLQLT